ncbi:hypothetical protein NliqN6_4661 [Naganishia liquefaciens]|uniref:SAP domain-containing protein n=1 Tax=Naganishia liquefaciens TaxID=104408 RepID=A0A8H3TWB3_9TREE|nr:hypothetical protein NliqN6_4661 [Naganishia liquefaciens]
MSYDILHNDVALKSLKRQQLVQLCKKYGLRASGKNVELISRLQNYGSSLSVEQRQAAEETVDSVADFEGTTGSDSSSDDDDEDSEQHSASQATQHPVMSHLSAQDQPSEMSPNGVSGRTDTWVVLHRESSADQRGPSLAEIEQAGSIASWKSAQNGGSRLVESAGITPISLPRSRTIMSRVGAIKTAGSSLNLRLRNASSSSLESMKRKAAGKSLIDKSHLSSFTSARNLPEQEENTPVNGQEQKMQPPIVGVSARHGHMSHSGAPSTMQMISAKGNADDYGSSDQHADLRQKSFSLLDEVIPHSPPPKPQSVLTPFCKYPIKKSISKRSIPTRPLNGPFSDENLTATDGLKVTANLVNEEEDDRPIPGAFPTPPSKRKEAFVFGSKSAIAGISNEEFSIAGDAVLEEMNKKLRARGIASIGQMPDREEVLQRNTRLTETSRNAFQGRSAPKGRFEAAHAKQFARFVRPTFLLDDNPQTDRPKSKLGFLTASANSVKATVSALQRRLSGGPEMTLQGLPTPRSILSGSRSGLEFVPLLHLSHRSTGQAKEGGLPDVSPMRKSSKFETGRTASKSADQPVTGLSLAYDIHVRRSDSSLALKTASNAVNRLKPMPTPSTNLSGSGKGIMARPGFSASNTIGYEYRRTCRLPPPLPPTATVAPLNLLERSCSKSSQKDLKASEAKPLSTPSVNLPRSHSSTLLRPTASSLARMQATVQPPSLVSGSTQSSTANHQQRLPFKSNVTGTAPARVIPPSPLPSPCKKLMVPKSPHRRAMEKHILNGRTSGMPSAAGGFKTKTSQASLAIGQKRREIEERRRARSRAGVNIY